MPPNDSKPPHRIAVEPLGKRLFISYSVDGKDLPLIKTDLAFVLAETSYPARCYFPKNAVLSPFKLIANETKETYSPYKGFVTYYDVLIEDDRLDALFWSYSETFENIDAKDIDGLLCLDYFSQQCKVQVDGEPVTIQQAKQQCAEILDAHPSSVSSHYQAKPSEEERQQQRSSRHHERLGVRPPTMQRSGSSGPPPPAGLIAARPTGVDLEPDSADPMIADFIYRMDDQAHEDNVGSQQESESARPADGSLDEHLAWFQDRPWYKRPSEKWLRPFAFAIAMAGGMCLGPKLELLNMLVCEQVLGDDRIGRVILQEPHLNASASFTSMPYQSWIGGDDQHSAIESYSQAALFSPSAVSPAMVWLSNLLDDPVAKARSNSMGLPVPKRPSKDCYQSPQVQSSLASLQLRMTLSMGILAALTTGFWSNLSSRMGRLPVLRITILGIICTDLVMLTVAMVPRSSLPAGLNFLLIGTTIEGLLGGYSTAIAVHQSYISDSTQSGTRARIFAHFMGIVYGGLALGPTLGGLLVRKTDNILTPFWFTLGVHLLYALFIGFIIPESTNEDSRGKAKVDYETSRREMKRPAEERRTAELQPLLGSSSNWTGPQKPFSKRLYKRIKVAFMSSVFYTPMEPLSFLLPDKVQVIEEDQPSRSASFVAPEASASHISVSHVPHKMRYDCNLFFLSLTYFVEAAVVGILAFKMQYAQKQFLWRSAELGMYLTFAGLTRVAALGLLLPFVIKMLHRPVKALRLPHDGVEGEGSERRHSTLDPDGRIIPSYGSTDTPSLSSTTDETVEELWTLRAKHLRLIHDSKFDLKLARISVLVNIVSYFTLIFAKTPALFLVGTALTALGGGGGAAMSSLALSLLKSPSEAGKLFGAWSIASALAGTVVGPILFAKVFEMTTESFVGAIFVVGTGMFVIAFLILSLVKVRKPISLPSLPARPQAKPSNAEEPPKNTFTMKTRKNEDTKKRAGLPFDRD